MNLQQLKEFPYRQFSFPLLRKKRALEQRWSRNTVVYQIYPRSFNDSNGDGIGDLQGIIDRLDYLNDGTDHSLGVGAIWLSPFYPSPMADMGYDISDYYSIDPIFGTLEDFDRLVTAAHKRKMRVIIDFVANHTSQMHPWFLQSQKSHTNAKADWYIWKDPKSDGSPPNNWQSVFGGSAWEFVKERNQYYLHSFLKAQPDLNWRNPDVKKEMFTVLAFWLNKGVDGIRVDAANHLLKDERFLDEPLNPEYKPGTTKPWYQYLHPYMRNHPRLPREIYKPMAEFVAGFGDTFIITEANLPIPAMKKFYEATPNHRLSPFNFNLFHLPWDAQAIQQCIEEMEKTLEKDDFPNWVLGNHDKPRLATRLGEEQTRIAAVLLLTLRGMPFIYNGDEIGMKNGSIRPDEVQDRFEKNEPGQGLGRDPERTPMQWNTKKYAGFSTHRPWLPLAKDVEKTNVVTESFDPHSLLSLYRHLIHLRNISKVLKHGSYKTIPTTHQTVLAYERCYERETCLIVLNFSDKKISVSCKTAVESGRIVLSSFLDKKEGNYISLKNLPLRPHEGYIIAVE